MPKVRNIDLLPEDVRADLAMKIREERYGSLVFITEWLHSIGHTHIGKTAVGAFALDLKRADAAREAADTLSEGQFRVMDLRLRCLDIASRTGPRADLFGRADEYFAWASRQG